MGAISYSTKSSEKSSNVKSLVVVGGIIAAVALSLFAYLMFYTAPEITVEVVKVIAVTEAGCIAETLDGFATNIGACNAQPGDYVSAAVDQNVKERAAAMNPTS